jgi:hypothetical protein
MGIGRKKTIKETNSPTIIKKTFGKTGLYVKNKKNYEIFYQGRLLEQGSLKGQPRLSNAREIVKRDWTLKKGYKRTIDRLPSSFEISFTRKAEIGDKGESKGIAGNRPQIHKIKTKGNETITPYQYVVSYIDHKGNNISARSQMKGRTFAKSDEEMQVQAWDNFYKRYSAFQHGNFTDTEHGTSNEGRKMVLNLPTRERNIIREGYVSYRG